MAQLDEQERLYLVSQWILERPPHVRAVAERLRPGDCSRNNEGGHYMVVSYEEEKDGTVTVTAQHGADSFLPGVTVFGIHPDALEPCNCGNWRP